MGEQTNPENVSDCRGELSGNEITTEEVIINMEKKGCSAEEIELAVEILGEYEE